MKHRRGPPLQVANAAGVRRYSNYAIGDMGPFAAMRLRGGVCSLDNHHPSGLGYAVVAEAVRRALPAGFAPGPPVPVTDREDAILRDPPWPGIDVFDALHRRPPGVGEREVAIETAAPGALRDLLRLVMCPPWLR
jgi:hypothetical protein